MKVLVSGGAGYIGSHVLRKLIDLGHEAVVIDDLSHGHKEAIEAAGRGRVPFVQAQVSNRDAVRRAHALLPFDAVIHFAAFIEVGESVRDPIKYYENNFSQALSFLAILNELDVKKFVFSSTAAVYGIPAEVPIRENAALSPINPYGRSKLMVEGALADLATAYDFSYAVLRYFNVAGAHPDGSIGEAHEPESHVIPRILAAAQNEEQSFEIYGNDYPTADGTCVRDYIHVDDLAFAHVLALESLKDRKGEVYNLGSEHGFSVLELLKACELVTGRSIKRVVKKRRPGDPPALVASSDKIRRDLGWERRYTNLETIVAHAWQWLQKKAY